MMAQLSLYLDDALMGRLKRRAGHEGVSVSKYVSRLVEENLLYTWPTGYFDLFGSIDDETFVEPMDPPFDIDSSEAWDDSGGAELGEGDGDRPRVDGVA